MCEITDMITPLLQISSFQENHSSMKRDITDMLKKFWETDSIGIIENKDPISQMPFSVKRDEEISFNGQHYEVALPWK